MDGPTTVGVLSLLTGSLVTVIVAIINSRSANKNADLANLRDAQQRLADGYRVDAESERKERHAVEDDLTNERHETARQAAIIAQLTGENAQLRARNQYLERIHDRGSHYDPPS